VEALGSDINLWWDSVCSFRSGSLLVCYHIALSDDVL